MKPVITAVVLQALWSLGHAAVKTKFFALLVMAGMALSFLGVNELLILFGGGIVAGFGRLIVRQIKRGHQLFFFVSWSPLALSIQSGAAAGATISFGLLPLVLFFVKVGSILYGSGYVLLVFLRADLVERWHWLSDSQLLDAIAVGQVTPGPLFTTATFIGYILGGPVGTIVATLGIFLPALFFVAVSGPLVPRIRRSETAGAFLDGVIAASLALMIVVTYQLDRAALIDPVTIALAVLSAVILFQFRLNSVWLVLIGAILGLLLYG